MNPQRLSFVVAAIFHGALIAAGVAYSYWHVEELTPPTLRVAFVSMTPPRPPPPAPPPPPVVSGLATARNSAPPPPPPPPGRHAGAQKVAISEKILQPAAPPDDEADPVDRSVTADAGPELDAGGDDDVGEDDGVDGGVKGGTVGGTPGGSLGRTGKGGDAPQGPRMMSAQFGALRREWGDMPGFPESLIRGEKVYVVEATICVSTSGTVDAVTVTKRSDTQLDANVLKSVATWRYRPMTVNNTPVPFCYPARFEFRSER